MSKNTFADDIHLKKNIYTVENKSNETMNKSVLI